MPNDAPPPPAETVNPFINKEAACPVCQQKGFQRKLKAHLFPEKSRDVDKRPLSFQPKKAGLEQIHPLVYYLWHCPNCRYTAWPGAFEDPTKGLPLTMAKFRAALLEPPSAEKAAGRVWQRLAEGAEGPDLDFFLGVKRHLLAIFQLLILKSLTGVRDSLSLGRYYLRLSWLYRELEEKPDLADQASQVRALLAELKALWPQAPEGAEAAGLRAAQEYEAFLAQSTALENLGEVCDLMLLITRIYIKLQRPDPARTMWSKAHDLARGTEAAKRKLEEQYSRAQDQARSPTKVLAEAAKASLPEISAKIVEMDALGRTLRNKTQEVRNLLHDLSDDLAASPAGDGLDASLGGKPKPKKKGFGLFK